MNIILLNNVSDEYHTFKELYDIRLAYNVALFNYIYSTDISGRYTIFKAKRHFDDTSWDNYFIFVLLLATYDSDNNLITKQISNHYHIDDWDKFKIPEYEKSIVPYDGHTIQDCIDILINLE